MERLRLEKQGAGVAWMWSVLLCLDRGERVRDQKGFQLASVRREGVWFDRAIDLSDVRLLSLSGKAGHLQTISRPCRVDV